MKASQVRRKRLTALRTSRGIPAAGRLYRVTPTFGNGGRRVVGVCDRVVGTRKRRFALRRRTKNVLCGGVIVMSRGARNKPKLHCLACRTRRADAREERDRQQQKPWLRTRNDHRRSSVAMVLRRFTRRAS